MGKIPARFLRQFSVGDIADNNNQAGLVPHLDNIGRKRNVTDVPGFRTNRTFDIPDRLASSKTNHLLGVAAFGKTEIQIAQGTTDWFLRLIAEHFYPMIIDVDQGAVPLTNDRHWVRARAECDSESLFSFSVFLDSCRQQHDWNCYDDEKHLDRARIDLRAFIYEWSMAMSTAPNGKKRNSQNRCTCCASSKTEHGPKQKRQRHIKQNRIGIFSCVVQHDGARNHQAKKKDASFHSAPVRYLSPLSGPKMTPGYNRRHNSQSGQRV